MFSTASKADFIFYTYVVWQCFQFGLVKNLVIWHRITGLFEKGLLNSYIIGQCTSLVVLVFFVFLFFIRCHIFPRENSLNPFPNKPWFLRVCSTSLLKTLWEKEKLLVMSNFSFSHGVFYPFG